MNIWYLYRHIRLDKNEPFYIGIGKEKNYRRAYDKIRRNNFWKNIVAKTEYIVEILLDNLTEEQVLEKEREFILLYGRKNLGTGILVNLTNGGDCTGGYVRTKEMIEKHRELIKGFKHTPEAIEKIKIAARNMSDETKEKMGLSRRGKKRILTTEAREKMRQGAFKSHINRKIIEKARPQFTGTIF